ncbi:DNA mismatch repair endonuclease MutL [Clostridia bacterium OttesenSCG-928-F22]|nr:DNA mismatch repair endonuclease MutL [Clostridia bacterium OttesenSCG-928-F22]
MPVINRLGDEISSKIAAGEVVERPASIVKELLENAIDAHSTSISVEIRDGGISYIRVSDNGCGMDTEDARTCFERYATSKIAASDDLLSIATLGFRGEALYSIAAVSKVVLTTCMQGSESGVRITMHGGECIGAEEVGCPEGTMLVIRDLFYNTPARLKFLKKKSIEAGYVGDIVARLILAHPEIAFRFVSDDKTIYFASGNGNLHDAIYTVYGKEIVQYLHSTDYQSNNVSVTGFVGGPEIARSNRTQQSTFINGRYVRQPLVAQAVQEAFDTRLMIGKFAFFVLCIEMDPSLLDVNVHPNKLQVRFHEEAAVREAVKEAVRLALQKPYYTEKHLNAPPVTILSNKNLDMPQKPDDTPKEELTQMGFQHLQAGKEMLNQKYSAEGLSYEAIQPAAPTIQQTNQQSDKLMLAQAHSILDIKGDAIIGEVRPKQAEEEQHDDGAFGTAPVEMMQVIGQLFATYILAQKGERFYIIDQHAAHERKNYEDFMQKAVQAQTLSQPLLTPIVLDLTPMEMTNVRENLSLLEEIGFELEEFGPLSYSVRAVPYIMGAPQTKEFFREYLDNIQYFVPRENVVKKRERLITMSCKKAIKGGDKLHDKEIFELIQAIESGDIPLTCPHGRPVITSMSRADIEKAFGRRV